MIGTHHPGSGLEHDPVMQLRLPGGGSFIHLTPDHDRPEQHVREPGANGQRVGMLDAQRPHPGIEHDPVVPLRSLPEAPLVPTPPHHRVGNLDVGDQGVGMLQAQQASLDVKHRTVIPLGRLEAAPLQQQIRQREPGGQRVGVLLPQLTLARLAVRAQLPLGLAEFVLVHQVLDVARFEGLGLLPPGGLCRPCSANPP
jgi:hypothetical protein